MTSKTTAASAFSSFADKLYPRSYTVHRIENDDASLHVDGNINKAVWQNIKWSEPFGDIQGSLRDDNDNDGSSLTENNDDAIPTTRFKALYDDNYLYIAAMLHPAPNMSTEAHYTKRNSPIFHTDSDFEVFVDVGFWLKNNGTHSDYSKNHHQVQQDHDNSVCDNKNGSNSCSRILRQTWHWNYKELELNALNTVWNLMLDKPYQDGGTEHSGRVAPPEDSQHYYEVYHQKTATRVVSGRLNDNDDSNKNGQGALWTVEIALAFRDLQQQTTLSSSSLSTTTTTTSPSFFFRKPQPGTFWRMNFSRVERKGSINWTWQPQIRWDPAKQQFAGIVDMHLPDAWGYFVFADADAAAAARIEATEEGEEAAAAPADNADSQRRATLASFRDPHWTLKLAATSLYYAQHYHKDQTGAFATSIDDLILPKELFHGALHVDMTANGSTTFEAILTSSDQRCPGCDAPDRVRIRQDRFMTVEKRPLIADNSAS